MSFCSQVTTQLGVDAADVLICDHHTRALEYASARGFRTRGMEEAHLHLDRSVAGQVVLERRPLHLADLAHTTRQFTRAEFMAQEGFRAYSAVPLLAKGLSLGVLEVFHRAPLEPDLDWLDFLSALAGQTAIVVDSASLSEISRRSNDELILAYDSTIESWSRAVDLRDKETEGHSRRVTEMTLRLAQILGVGRADLVHMRRGALLHDIGKLGIPETIVLKPGPLTADEWVIVRRHPALAYDWLAPTAYLGPAL